jgi:5'-nucleotidase
MEAIQIYHTNDIHSHLEHWPRIEHFLKSQKESHQKIQEDVFLFDIGDFIDRWHPYSEGTMGKGNIELLNDCAYTAVTIGNNEGINFPYEDLDHLYDEARFDILLANLYKKGNIYPDWLKPYQIYQTQQGTRIGVIGLTAPFSHLYKLLGWEITDPIFELKRWLKRLKEEADIIILLSHLGIQTDEEMAAEFPEVDVILGGHTHHFLEKGRVIGNTIIAAAGKYGEFVGRVSLQLDEQKRIQSKEAILYDVEKLPEQEKTDAFLKKGKELLQQKVTTLPIPLTNNPFQETKLSQMLCQALREWCGADCAFINAGLLLGPLSGDVTLYDLLTICPHPINPCRIELSGRELKAVLLQTRDKSWPERRLKGLGFRGTVMGVIVYDRIRFAENNTIYLNGKKVDPTKSYTLALPDMFTFGHFFTEIFSQKPKQYFLPEFLRDVLRWKLESE